MFGCASKFIKFSETLEKKIVFFHIHDKVVLFHANVSIFA